MSPQLWQTLWLSLRIAAMAVTLSFIVTIPLAYFNARSRYHGKSIVEALMVIPMVLPPTVVGYLIIAALGARGWIGQYLNQSMSYSIMFRMEGAVLAAAIVAAPLLYLPTRAAFAAVAREMEDAARIEGASRLQLFLRISLPLASRGIASGTLLAFARALGEFGATIMVFGIRLNHTTLPISIYLDYEEGDMHHALPAVVALCVVSWTLTLFYNRASLSRQD
jgi:molybdate transport system permease protein